MDNIQYLLALHSVDGLGPARLKKLYDNFKDWKIIWEASSKEILNLGIPENVVALLAETRKTLNPDEYLEYIQKSNIKILTFFEDDYPKLLKQIYDPPIILYYRGEFSPSDEKALAVVGTRKITGYGKIVTEKFTTEISRAGLTIVSGLARGVDTLAHKATLAAGGRTLAVLGGGLNQIFPPENSPLALQIADGSGVVLSEFPPDHPALSGNFPARNRIISGLSLATLVTEAASDSGSLITARLALEQGRDVFAVPGPITSDLSNGPADLIKEGAKLVITPNEVLEEIGMMGGQNSELRVQNETNLSDIEKKVFDCLDGSGKHIDEVCRELSLSAAQVSGTLVKMEILGLVRNLGAGTYCRS